MDKVILFTNWTTEDFICHWNSEPYLLPKKSSRFYPEYLANHFAKHLTDREMNKAKIVTDHFSRQEFLDKCFGEEVAVTSQEKADEVVMNQPKEVVEEVKPEPVEEEVVVVEKKKPGRPKKIVEEDFAGLKEE